MPEATQLLINKPQAPNPGAGNSSAQDSESGQNRGFSSVFDDKVSQTLEASTPTGAKLADKSAPAPKAEKVENGLQDTADDGKALPQQAAEVVEETPAHEAVVTALNGSSSHGDDAAILALATDADIDASPVDSDDMLQTGNTVNTPTTEDVATGGETPAIDAESLAAAADDVTAIPVPATGIYPEQGTSKEARIASTVGQSSPVAQLVANTHKGQAAAQQTHAVNEDAEADALLLSDGEQDELLLEKQQEGEFSTKLRGLVDQVKRALGVSQNSAANTTASQSNPAVNTGATVTPATQLAADTPAVQGSSTTSINIGLKQDGWDEAMGQRVQWMVSKGIQKADVRLNPPNLGPLEVRVNMTDEGAEVRFISQHGVVRDSVESAMPRLREMLAEQGIDLANVDVSEHSVAQDNTQQDADHQGNGGNGRGLSAGDNDGQDGVVVANTRVSEGMLDLFA